MINNGHSNAYTSEYETNFHFEVGKQIMNDSIEMFANNFIEPLILDKVIFYFFIAK